MYDLHSILIQLKKEDTPLHGVMVRCVRCFYQWLDPTLWEGSALFELWAQELELIYGDLHQRLSPNAKTDAGSLGDRFGFDTPPELPRLLQSIQTFYSVLIKLIAWMKRGEDGSVAAGVEPCLVPKANQLAGVDDVFNAVLVKGDMLGDVVFYGKGAGKLPTASAVVADVVDALKNGVKVHDSLFWQPAEPVEGMLTDPAPAAYYVRVEGIAPAVAEAIYGKGHVVEEHFDGCSYFVDSADDKALAEAARKVEAMGGSVKLVLRRLPEDA